VVVRHRRRVLLCRRGNPRFLVETGSRPLHAVALYGWIRLPGVGLFETGRRVTGAKPVYIGGAALCLFGAVIYVAAPVLPVAGSVATVTGLLSVGIGQTAGIVGAVYRY
jgi:hypothetical protein